MAVLRQFAQLRAQSGAPWGQASAEYLATCDPAGASQKLEGTPETHGDRATVSRAAAKWGLERIMPGAALREFLNHGADGAVFAVAGVHGGELAMKMVQMNRIHARQGYNVMPTAAFCREVQMMKMLAANGVAPRVLAAGHNDTHGFIVMDRLDGRLADYTNVAGREAGVERELDDILNRALDVGIVCSDVKGANFMMKGDTVKWIDTGARFCKSQNLVTDAGPINLRDPETRSMILDVQRILVSARLYVHSRARPKMIIFADRIGAMTGERLARLDQFASELREVNETTIDPEEQRFLQQPFFLVGDQVHAAKPWGPSTTVAVLQRALSKTNVKREHEGSGHAEKKSKFAQCSIFMA